MIIDLHNHCELSKNTSLSFDDYLQNAQKKEISFAITEHNCLYYRSGKIGNISFFSGIEILNNYGDFIVFGAPEDCVGLRQDMHKLINYIHRCGGVIIAAHPYSGYGVCKSTDDETANEILKLVDAIEVYNGLADDDSCKKADILAQIHKKPSTGGSDAHNINELFTAGTKFIDKIENINDLVNSIKYGRCEPIKID